MQETNKSRRHYMDRILKNVKPWLSIHCQKAAKVGTVQSCCLISTNLFNAC